MPICVHKEVNTRKTINYRELDIHCCWTCMHSEYEIVNLYCNRYELNVRYTGICKFYEEIEE